MSLSKPRHSGLSRARDQSAWPWLTRHRCTREIGRPVQDGGISGGLCRRFWGTGAGRRPPAPRLSQRQGEGAEGGERRRPRCRSRRPLYAHGQGLSWLARGTRRGLPCLTWHLDTDTPLGSRGGCRRGAACGPGVAAALSALPCRPGQGTSLLLLLLFGGCSEGAIFLPRTGLVPLPDPTARAAGASGCPRPSRPRVPFPWRGPEERVPSRRSVARCLRVKSQSCLLPPPQGSAEVPSACPETQGQPWEQPGPRHFGLAAPVCSEGGQV